MNILDLYLIAICSVVLETPSALGWLWYRKSSSADVCTVIKPAGNQCNKIKDFDTAKKQSESCSGRECTFCTQLQLKSINLKGPVCVTMKYKLTNNEVAFEATYNKARVVDEDIPAASPYPVCFGAPHVADMSLVCFYLTEVTKQNYYTRVCFVVHAQILTQKQAVYDFGCHNLKYGAGKTALKSGSSDCGLKPEWTAAITFSIFTIIQLGNV